MKTTTMLLVPSELGKIAKEVIFKGPLFIGGFDDNFLVNGQCDPISAFLNNFIEKAVYLANINNLDLSDELDLMYLNANRFVVQDVMENSQAFFFRSKTLELFDIAALHEYEDSDDILSFYEEKLFDAAKIIEESFIDEELLSSKIINGVLVFYTAFIYSGFVNVDAEKDAIFLDYSYHLDQEITHAFNNAESDSLILDPMTGETTIFSLYLKRNDERIKRAKSFNSRKTNHQALF